MPENSDSGLVSPKSGHITTPPKLQTSFSASEVSSKNGANGNIMGSNNNHAQQHFHNHNANMGRIPAGAFSHRHSRELSADSTTRDQGASFQSFQSALQGSAAPFGAPMAAQAPFVPGMGSQQLGAAAPNSFNANFFAGNSYQLPGPNNHQAPINTNMLQSGMQQLNLNGLGASNQFASQQNFQNFSNFPQGAPQQPRDSQARVIQNRRQVDSDGKQTLNTANSPFD